MSSFVHLHVHSHYSLLQSSIRLDELVARAKAHGAPAVAVTDDGNLFGAVELCKAAKKAGVKPILGCCLHVARGSRLERPASSGPETEPWRLVVLVMDETGYRNLVRLSSAGYLEGLHRGVPRVDEELLRQHHDGLIALSAGLEGEVGAALRRGRADLAEEAARKLAGIFAPGADGKPRFYLELQDHGLPEESEVNAGLRGLASRLGLPLVATNDCRFLLPEHFEAQRALTCIGAGTTLDDPISLVSTIHHHVRSPDEMAAAFPDDAEALAATVEIAERCRFVIAGREPLLPHFDVPAGETLSSYFRRVAEEGLAARLEEIGSGADGDPYRARLAYELDVICGMGLEGYFLIVWDLMRFAREQGVPVGPGRGSAAGSVVAWSLRITNIDPLRHGLLFERFLNPERKSLPDIDMDFCQRRRGELIRYVQEKYGADHVAQIITFGTLNARSVIRDVGRILNMTFGETDRIAKLVPEELDITLEKALKDSPALAELERTDERVARLLRIARALEGLARNAGVHAAGVIIAPEPIERLAPLFRTGRDEITTQFDKDEAEHVGLLKMDFLGLKTLTVIDDAVKSVWRRTGERIDLEALPLDDAATFELFRRARTLGIFQFESSGMRDLIRKFQPGAFEDLVALNALYRPGPLKSGYVQEFVERRHGRVKVSYPHPDLEEILESTYGTMVYQEQVMNIAVRLAGYTLGEADTLRKAMGKKLADVMATQRDKFVKGSVGRGVEARVATDIFDSMAKFAEYGFNKSHSAAYALVAYWSAWLKAHHPAHFMAAMLTSEGDHTAKVVRHVNECKEMGLEVLPPDVNESEEDFTVVGERTIRFGLSAIKGVGHGAIDSVLAARARAGRFSSLFDFCAEIDLRLNNKKVLEALVKAGALDSVAGGAPRSALMAALDSAVDAAAALRADRESGQTSLFGEPQAGPASSAPARELPQVPAWSKHDVLKYEKEVLGFYVSGHPLEAHAQVLARVATAQVADLPEKNGHEVTVAGMVAAVRKTRTKKGDWMAFVTLEDLTGTCEVIAFPEAWRKAQEMVIADAAICVKGVVEVDGDRGKILAAAVTPLGTAQRDAAAGVLVKLPEGLSSSRLDEALARIDDVLAEAPGGCPVWFEVPVPEVGAVRVQAASRFAVRPDASVISALEQVAGEGRVALLFA